VARDGHGPLIPESLAVHMQMWAVNFLVVRVAVRCPAQVQPNKYHNDARPILMSDFQQVDSSSAKVQNELLAFIGRDKRGGDELSGVRIAVSGIVHAVLLHGDEG